MALNVAVTLADCYAAFATPHLYEVPPPGAPPATPGALAAANIDIFPAENVQPRARRRIRWNLKAPVLAVEKNDEGIVLGVLGDMLEAAADVAPSALGDIGLQDGLDILQTVGRTARRIRDRVVPRHDERVLRIDPLKVRIALQGVESLGLAYGYIVDAEARWFKSDEDDPCDIGRLHCQELQDTNGVRARGVPMVSGNDLSTDKFRGPLLVAGPYALADPEFQVELDVLATATVDREVLPGCESFLTVVRAVELTIVCGTQAAVLDELNRASQAADMASARIAGAIERASARVARALLCPQARDAAGPAVGAATELAGMLRALASGEVRDIGAFVAALPQRRLQALATELGIAPLARDEATGQALAAVKSRLDLG